MENETADFKAIVKQITTMSYKAQVTFAAMLIQQMGASRCKTILRYANSRLKAIQKENSNTSIDVNGNINFSDYRY